MSTVTSTAWRIAGALALAGVAAAAAVGPSGAAGGHVEPRRIPSAAAAGASASPSAAVEPRRITSTAPTESDPTTPRPSTSSEPPWAAGIERYLAAWAAADKVGFTSSATFFALDAHQDFRAFNNFEGSSRAAIAQNLRDSMQIPPRFADGFDQTDAAGPGSVEDEAPYVSLDSVVPVGHAAGDDWQGMSTAVVVRITAAGIEDHTGLWAASTAGMLFEVDADEVAAPARAYLAAWRSGDPDQVAALYAEDATLRDQLADIDRAGADRVAALVDASPELGGLGPARVHTLPGEAGDAIYVNGSFSYLLTRVLTPGLGVDQVVLLVDVADADCPGPVAVFLQLDTRGQITHEERFRRIDALRRCLPADQRPSGWWDVATLPATPPVTRTGSVPGGRHDIAVWNGDPRIDPIITWARERFAAAGLPPPEPISVTFLPAVPGDRWATYGFLHGSSAPDLGLPFTAGEACVDEACTAWTREARLATLHELAVLSFAPRLRNLAPTYDIRADRGERYLQQHGLTWWQDGARPSEQGAERAAATIAWGLMDQPTPPEQQVGALTCAELADDFETLTLTTPDPRACAERDSVGQAPSASPGGAP